MDDIKATVSVTSQLNCVVRSGALQKAFTDLYTHSKNCVELGGDHAET